MIERIYIGTWLPRTHVHLTELFDFFKNCSGPDLNPGRLKELHEKLNIQEIVFSNNHDFDSLKIVSKGVTTTITEDGVILLMMTGVADVDAGLTEIKSFYIDNLGPALAYLFSRGAPLPQTLVNIKEFYPSIVVGKNITRDEAQEIISSQNTKLLAKNSTEELEIFYGQDLEIINILNPGSEVSIDALITNAIFIHSFSDLLKRYLIAHRSTWEDISAIKEARDMRYQDFPKIRSRILDSLKTTSFIKTRLLQMNDILEARNAVMDETLRQTLTKLGFENFKVLESSCRYFNDLWQMTGDYAQSTLALFETFLAENTQREIRLLQQVTVIGAVVGFFGMNIAFPWDESWPEHFLSSLMVFGVLILAIAVFYQIIKIKIRNRRFNISEKRP